MATDFNDMAAILGNSAVAEAINEAVAPLAIPASADWTDPLPLTIRVGSQPYPLDALPDKIQAAVAEVQSFTKAPIPLVGSCALGAVSLATQAHIDVKRAEGLVGPISIYLLTIADSGERKTTCDEFFARGIRDYQQRATEKLKPELDRYRAEIAAWEAKHGGVKEKIRQLARTNRATAEFEKALRDAELSRPKEPRIPRLIRGDDTPENLAWAMMYEWPSGGVMSSEAALVLGSYGMGKETIMRNLGLLNLLWDGGSLPIGRRKSESFTVKGARLTVALQVQESTLRNFLERSEGLARGTGFLARFLLAWPESTQGFRPFADAPAHWPALTAFNTRIEEILEYEVKINDDGSLSPSVMSLSPQAKAGWITYHDAIEQELADGGELRDIRDVASKSADNAARLAALFHVFDHGFDGDIAPEAFEGASRIAAWHLNESRRFFGELNLPTGEANAGKLDRWLIDECQRTKMNVVSTQRILQYGPAALREKSSLEAAIPYLEQLHRVRLEEYGHRRELQVNPALLLVGSAA